jgi:hypothetical protein
MGIKRVVDKSEVEVLKVNKSKYLTLLDEIVKTLQENQGKYVEIDIADVFPLRNKLNQLKNSGALTYEYQHLKISKIKANDNKVAAYVRWTEQISEPKPRKKRKQNITKTDTNQQPQTQSNNQQ